jgi:nucleotide-binding universal stress UspA family protein
MKILIAYDGSKCADESLVELQNAGLPERAEVLIASVAEQGMPAPRSIGMVETHFAEGYADLLLEARLMARNAHSRLHTYFPKWEIEDEAILGSPARVILETVERWEPNLVVVGSHGRSAIGRFLLGSVSQKVATEAGYSVRISRGRARKPGHALRIIIGVDGSAGALEAVRAVVERRWPTDCEVLVLTAEFVLLPEEPDRRVGPTSAWLYGEHARRRLATEVAVLSLRTAGLSVRHMIKEGLAKDVLLDVAEAWDADCIFVGAQELTLLDRFLLGSVAAAVAASAPCSVEIVRRGSKKQ